MTIKDAADLLVEGSLYVFEIDKLKNYSFTLFKCSLIFLETDYYDNPGFGFQTIKIFFYDIENNTKLFVKAESRNHLWRCPEDAEIASNNGHVGYINLIPIEKIG